MEKSTVYVYRVYIETNLCGSGSHLDVTATAAAAKCPNIEVIVVVVLSELMNKRESEMRESAVCVREGQSC